MADEFNMYDLAPFRPHHPFQVLPRLRDEDVAEAEALDQFADEALIESIDGSDWVYTVFLEGEPVGFVGWRMDEEGDALIWSVGTDRMTEYPLSFHRTSIDLIRSLLEAFPVLYNRVHQENTVHIEWLKRLGAEFFPSDTPGFINFQITR